METFVPINLGENKVANRLQKLPAYTTFDDPSAAKKEKCSTIILIRLT
jgi:hypothetical protein